MAFKKLDRALEGGRHTRAQRRHTVGVGCARIGRAESSVANPNEHGQTDQMKVQQMLSPPLPLSAIFELTLHLLEDGLSGTMKGFGGVGGGGLWEHSVHHFQAKS